jgi:ferredoxin
MDGEASTIQEERRPVRGQTVCIDRTLCVGFEDCITQAPGAFRLDDEGIATFDEPDSIDPERLLEACSACPVDAIRVLNGEGQQIVP